MMLEDASYLLARHLPALLNVLHREGWDRFDVVYPPTGLKLLTVDLPREEILAVADEGAFRRRGVITLFGRRCQGSQTSKSV